MYAQSDPQAPPKYTYREKEMSLWDRIEIHEGDVTLSELVSIIEEQEGMEIDMIGIGKALVYFGWMSPAKRKERMSQKMSSSFLFFFCFFFVLFCFLPCVKFFHEFFFALSYLFQRRNY